MSPPLASRIASLSPEKRALLEARLAQRGLDAAAAPEAIARRTAAAPPPLSFAQQRMWLHDQLDPGSAVYNEANLIRLTGALNASALESALNSVVARHEVLRTTYAPAGADGLPVQVIALALKLTLTREDLSGLADPERAASLRAMATAEVGQGFDLRRGPLLRTRLVRLSDLEHALLVTLHHSVSDGWSWGVLLSELSHFYRAADEGSTAALPPLPIQYSDYAAWQREALEGKALQKLVSYWRGRLADAPALLELPTDHPRPAVQTFRGARRGFELPPELAQAVFSVSQSEGVTPFMLLLAAFEVLLHRSSGQSDLVVGTPIDVRSRPELEGLIGCFINTVVVRNQVEGQHTFRELLAKVREAALGAYAHAELPFDALVEKLQPARNLSHSPIFQVLFGLQPVPPSATLGKLSVRAEEMGNPTSRLDLSIAMIEQGKRLLGSLEYSTDLFAAETIDRMLGHFQSLLAAAVADPTRAIGDLPMLTASELTTLQRWSQPATTPTLALGATVIEAFQAQVERSPHAIALRCEDQSITYRELNARANQLGHFLRAHGIGPEDKVGLCVERSIAQIVAMIGINKAGGAYVPLDPSLPKDRLRVLIDDCAPKLILSEHPLETGSSPRTFLLDSQSTPLADQPTANLTPPNPEHLAYLIYTSGTSGTPKAVMVEHRQLICTLRGAQAKFGFDASVVMPGKASFAFDMFLSELWDPLLCGGTTVLIPRERLLDLPRLAVDLEQMTATHLVPSMALELISAIRHRGGPDATLPNIRWVFTGGDQVPPALLTELQAVFPSARIFVLYGPTEGTIICSCFEVLRGTTTRGHLLGTSLPGARLRITDARGNLCPIGVPGELQLGGAGVTRGYLHQAALTAEKYLQTDDGRWYRTGDLARWRPDGNIEFLGRIDSQVKIRGFRIELGEIEATLQRSTEVADAAVVAHRDGTGDTRLIAYVVPSGAPGPEWVGRLRALLAEQLPAYMIPSSFLVLEALPLTPNGKVNRRALPVPTAERPELERPYLPARNAIEEVLAGIWAGVLGLPKVGMEDSFFDLGGHSLLATQVVSRVQDAFRVEVPLRALLERPTIASLAAALISREVRPGQTLAVAALQLKVQGLSPEQLEELLAQKRRARLNRGS